MKKMEHDERVALAKSRITKSISKNTRKLTLRQKRLATLIGSATLAVGASAGIAAGVAIEATKDRTVVYPMLNERVKASDFIYRSDAKPIVKTERIGSQEVTHAQMGPINFVSNYSRMMNHEKMEDWLNWFYHDVSWGPEIGTLSHISFLAGAQMEDGSVTLGYHTTSRDSSKIVLSPDVNFSNVMPKHLAQSMAYFMLNKLEHSFELNKALFPELAGTDAAHPSKDISYRQLAKKAYTPATTTGDKRLIMPFDFAKEIVNYFTNISRKQRIDIPFKNIMNPKFIPTQHIDNSYAFWDVYKKATDHWKDADTNLRDKLAILRLLGFSPLDESSNTLSQLFNDKDNNILPAKVDAFFNYFVNTDFFRSIANEHMFDSKTVGFSHDELKDALVKAFKEFLEENDVELKSLSSKIDASKYHLKTMGVMFRYSNKTSDIIQGLSEAINILNPWQYSEKTDKIAAIIGALNFYLQNNQISSSLPGTKSLGRQIMFDVYKKLINTRNVDKVANGEFLWNYVNPNGDYIKNKSGFSAANLNIIRQNIQHSNNYLIELSKYLDKKYQPGKVVNGNRNPGIPVYKENDTMYDAYVRRSSQDIMYTVSHEYGHHTTMFHGQDISAYNGIQSVGPNEGATQNHHPAIVTSAEVSATPNLATFVSGEKYAMFREAFSSSPYFQKILDDTSDGDSRTDITLQVYKDKLNIDFKTVIQEDYVGTFDDGIENFRAQQAWKVEPQYFGQNSLGFGTESVSRMLIDNLLFKLTSDKQWTRDDFQRGQSLIQTAYDELAKLKSTDSHAFDTDQSANVGEPRFAFPLGLDTPTSYVKPEDYFGSYVDANGNTMGLRDYIKTKISKPTYFFESSTTKYTSVLPGQTVAESKYHTYPLIADLGRLLRTKGGINQIVPEADQNVIFELEDAFFKRTEDKENYKYGYEHITWDAKADNLKIKAAMDAYLSDFDNYNTYIRGLQIIQGLNTVTKQINTTQTNNDGSLLLNAHEEAAPMETAFLKAYAKYRGDAIKTSLATGVEKPTNLLSLEAFVDKYTDAANITKVTDAVNGDHWEKSTPFTDESDFATGTTGDYLWKFVNDALVELKDASQGDVINTLTAEPLLRKMFQDAGATTKALFDGLFSRQALSGKAAYNNLLVDVQASGTGAAATGNYVGIDLDMNFGEVINDKFFIWRQFFNHLKMVAADSKTYDDFAAKLKEVSKTLFMYKGKLHLLKLDPKYIDEVIKPHFWNNTEKGGAILPMERGAKSVGAVVYVFNKEEDKTDYKTIFSTVSPGATPPTSFLRYSSSYAESLTRSLNQIGFSQYPELSSILGEYLDGDRSRFKSFRFDIYNNDVVGGALHNHQYTGGTLDQSLTATGQRVVGMFKNYFGMDKELSYIMRNQESGLYSFVGYSDQKNKYKSLVFTDVNDNIVSQTRMIYGVSNHHFYRKFADPTTKVSMEEDAHRYSWMTEFSPLGNWKNTLLRSGDYKVKFWEDKNNNGQIDKGELVALLNRQTTGNGQLNENGKSDDIAQVVGNPEHRERFTTNDELNREFMFRVSNILI